MLRKLGKKQHWHEGGMRKTVWGCEPSSGSCGVARICKGCGKGIELEKMALEVVNAIQGMIRRQPGVGCVEG